MKDWSWDRVGTLAVSVVTLLVVLFSGIRGVATKADLDALEAASPPPSTRCGPS